MGGGGAAACYRRCEGFPGSSAYLPRRSTFGEKACRTYVYRTSFSRPLPRKGIERPGLGPRNAAGPWRVDRARVRPCSILPIRLTLRWRISILRLYTPRKRPGPLGNVSDWGRSYLPRAVF